MGVCYMGRDLEESKKILVIDCRALTIERADITGILTTQITEMP